MDNFVKIKRIDKLTTAEVARIMQKSDEFVRYGLINNILPFGKAIKLPKSDKYNFFINPKEFWEYIGDITNKENVEIIKKLDRYYMDNGIFIL